MRKLAERRNELGLTLRDVERISGGRVSNAYLSQLENGKIESPSLSVASILAVILDTPIETLAAWLGEPANIKPVPICESCGQVIRSRSNQVMEDE